MSDEDLLIRIIENIIESKKIRSSQIIAVVETPPPNLTLRYGEQIIASDQIYCSNYLLPNYFREYKIEGIIDVMHQEVSQYNFDNTTSTNKEKEPDGHTHPISILAGSGTIDNTGDYKSHGKFWFTDTLTKGAEVLVDIVGVYYVVTARIVKMPSTAIEGGA